MYTQMTNALATTTIDAEIVDSPIEGYRPSPSADDLALLKDWIGSKRSPRTRKQYHRTIVQFLSFVRLHIYNVRPSHLQHWIDDMGERGLSADSQRSKVSAVKALFSYAHKVGYLERNLIAVVKTPQAKSKARDRIADEGRILAALHNPNLTATERLFLNVLYYSGCRVSEAIALKWADIADGVLTVTGKGDKQREIKIPARLQALLDDAQQGATADYIFATRSGKPVARNQANRWIKSIGAKCGIPQLSCHWLRHCHASHSLERGADINLVSETLGHSSVAVTSKYLHSAPDKSSGDYLAS